MSEHTKGPWNVVKREGMQTVESKADMVCHVYDWVAGYQLECDANASLIAAAPDMLEALKQLNRNNGANEDEEYNKEVEDLIDRAEGKGIE